MARTRVVTPVLCPGTRDRRPTQVDYRSRPTPNLPPTSPVRESGTLQRRPTGFNGEGTKSSAETDPVGGCTLSEESPGPPVRSVGKVRPTIVTVTLIGVQWCGRESEVALGQVWKYYQEKVYGEGGR